MRAWFLILLGGLSVITRLNAEMESVNFPELKSEMPLASSLLLVDWAIRILGLDLLCSVRLAFNVYIG